MVALAVFAPLLPYDAYRQNILHRNEVPSLKHWLGTDELGRDMVARIAVGARVSLIVAVTATLIAVAIGVMVGTLSAYIGGVTDGVLMRFVDSMYAFPDTLFAILMAALIKGQLSSHISGFLAPLAEVYKLSGGLLGVLLTLGLTGWLTTSRLVRSQVLSLKNTEYVLACRLAGASDWFIIRTHLLPNVAPVILLSVTFVVPNAILLEAGLSFMGDRRRPADAELGDDDRVRDPVDPVLSPSAHRAGPCHRLDAAGAQCDRGCAARSSGSRGQGIAKGLSMMLKRPMQCPEKRRPGRRPGSRFWRRATCGSGFPAAGASCAGRIGFAPSTASASASSPARPWRSWEKAVAARPRWAAPCPCCSARPAAASSSPMPI